MLSNQQFEPHPSFAHQANANVGLFQHPQHSQRGIGAEHHNYRPQPVPHRNFINPYMGDQTNGTIWNLIHDSVNKGFSGARSADGTTP